MTKIEDAVFDSLSREYICAACGKRFYMHYGTTLENYVYKVSTYGNEYKVYCKWSCFVKGKSELARLRLLKKTKMAGYTEEEARNWLKWAGEEIPSDEEISKARKKKKQDTSKLGVTCYDMVREKHDHIRLLKKEGYVWKQIRIKAGLTRWSVSTIVNAYLEVFGAEENSDAKSDSELKENKDE